MTLLDLRRPLFPHGYLYLGLSRVREATNIIIFTAEDSVLMGSRFGAAEEVDIIPVTTNVIYPELLTPTGVSIDGFKDRNAELEKKKKLITSDYCEAYDENIVMI